MGVRADAEIALDIAARPVEQNQGPAGHANKIQEGANNEEQADRDGKKREAGAKE